MELLLDVGNTRLKWLLNREGQASQSRLVDKPWERLLDEVWLGLERPARVIFVSVQPSEVNDALAQWIDSRWHCPVEQVASTRECAGIVSGYTEPARLGPDRLIAMVGARTVTSEPAIVVDCGTAVTIDMLDGKGRHRGGWIIPGLSLMGRSLSRGTGAIGDLPMAQGMPVTPEFGRDTESGIVQGGLAAIAGAIERAMELAMQTLGRQPDCLVTGGDGAQLAAMLGPQCRYVPNLVFAGLARYAEGADIP